MRSTCTTSTAGRRATISGDGSRHWWTGWPETGSSPDDGVWEVRSGRREFLYSRILCWVAIDRGIRLAGKRSLPAPLDRWLAARDAIYREVHESFWDRRSSRPSSE